MEVGWMVTKWESSASGGPFSPISFNFHTQDGQVEDGLG